MLALLLLALFALPLLTGPRLDGIARWIPAGPGDAARRMLTLPALALLAACDRALRAGGPAWGGAGQHASARRGERDGAGLRRCRNRRRPTNRRFGLVALAGLLAAVAAALRGDLPPQPFVEHVMASRAPIGCGGGRLVLEPGGSFALILRPGSAGPRRTLRARRDAARFTAAAMIANYPTPLIGYGASRDPGLCSGARTAHEARTMTLRPFHLAFPVHDLAAARAFWGGTIGCPEGRSSDEWIDFDFYGHQIVAHLAPDAAAARRIATRSTATTCRCRTSASC